MSFQQCHEQYSNKCGEYLTYMYNPHIWISFTSQHKIKSTESLLYYHVHLTDAVTESEPCYPSTFHWIGILDFLKILIACEISLWRL